MPLTQDRLIAILNAGLDYQSAFNTLVSAIKSEHFKYMNGQQSPNVSLDVINTLAYSDLLLQAKQSAETLLIERQHFLRYVNYNKHAAARMRRMRQKRGQDSQPATIIEPHATTQILQTGEAAFIGQRRRDEGKPAQLSPDEAADLELAKRMAEEFDRQARLSLTDAEIAEQEKREIEDESQKLDDAFKGEI